MKKLFAILLCLLIIPTLAYSETEKKVKVSSNDTTSGYLNGKLTAGSNISLIENSDGSNESLQINAVTSGSGTILDLGDDGSNESTAISEIATINDTYNIATEPSADKLRFDMSQKWPLSHQSVSLQANGTNCSAGNSPLGVDASGNSEGCFDVATETEFATHASRHNEGGADTIAYYHTVMDEASNLTKRRFLNFTGAGVSCADDAGNSRTNCTISGSAGSSYTTIKDEGSAVTQRSTVNFIGSGIVCVDNGGTLETDCTVSTGAASAYDTIQEEGSPLTQRSALNFVGSAFTASDTGTKTNVTTDAEVNGIADLASTGMVSHTAAGTFAERTLTGTTNEIDISNGTGVGGNPTFSLPSTVDLSGKSIFKIPTGTNPTVSAAGTIAEDTTQTQLLYGSTPNVLSPNRQACFTITDLTSTDDNFQVFVADRDITVTQVGCRYEGTGSTVATISLENAKTGTGMTHTAPTCVTGNNTASFQSVTANNAITSGDGIRFDTTNTPSPTTDDYTICFRYTEDRK